MPPLQSAAAGEKRLNFLRPPCSIPLPTNSADEAKKLHEPRSTATSYATSRAYSEAELNELIVSGMSMAEVTNTFGVPGATVPGPENVVLVL